MVFLNSSLYFVGLFLLGMCVFPFCFFLSLILTHLSTFLGYIQTNVSNIVVSKHLRSNNTSGHTGVGLDRRTGKWYAYINFQKKHYNLGLHKDKSAAIRARRAAEARLHDPVILEYWDSLTEKRKKEFQDYLRSTNK